MSNNKKIDINDNDISFFDITMKIMTSMAMALKSFDQTK